ncbi:MAG: lipid-A-disaccharide synthase [Pelagibacterales bacterium]|nr:lipid-A-disaccharide synthase [Pelagibacterales bacterium]
MRIKSKYKIYIIVGEESGENIGYEILSSLKKKINYRLYGIGGKKLNSLGLKSIFNFNELSVMGLFEVLPKIPKLLILMQKTFFNILQVEPDLIITIDAPDFAFRVLKKIKNKNNNFKTLHIVAPTVWAWKSRRAKKISKFVDNLFVLFPFEKKYFLPHGIKTTFIGHPLLNNNYQLNTTTNILGFKKNIISIFPGSRRGEIERHLSHILSFISKNNSYKMYKFLIIAVDRHIELINNIAKEFKNKINLYILNSSEYKNYAFKYSKYAIAVSGTISLELALNKVPLIVVYKLNFFSYLILKKLVKVKYISLANIILNKKIIPELIQKDFSFKKFNSELYSLINNKSKKHKQLIMFNKLEKILSCNKNDIAVREILKLIKVN